MLLRYECLKINIGSLCKSENNKSSLIMKNMIYPPLSPGLSYKEGSLRAELEWKRLNWHQMQTMRSTDGQKLWCCLCGRLPQSQEVTAQLSIWSSPGADVTGLVKEGNRLHPPAAEKHRVHRSTHCGWSRRRQLEGWIRIARDSTATQEV